MWTKVFVRIEILIFLCLMVIIYSGSSLVLNDTIDQVRLFTRPVEFDYYNWTIAALESKLSQATLASPFYFENTNRHKIVVDYLKITGEILQKETQLNLIYIDPSVKDPSSTSRQIKSEINSLYISQNKISQFAESVLEEQISEMIREEGLAWQGQPVPPVLFHITPLPYDLIISPRDKIEQKNSVSLISDLSVDKQESLENEIDHKLNVSSLVVPVGGIGSYPTMVERTTSLDWLSNTIAHEWIHNWLSYRPLGLHYEVSTELRTMNETTASIAGNEIGNLVMKKYYPELIADYSSYSIVNYPTSYLALMNFHVDQFDFRVEMHKTRVTVDEFLAEGKIDEAEKYMEKRRVVFWNNGYPIRKINQAYFAFYGAYADIPGGAAGEDPVGPAVRALRTQSPSLKVFLLDVSRMTSFESLQAAISQ